MRGVIITSDDNDNWATGIAITSNRIDLGGLTGGSRWGIVVVFSDTVSVNLNTVIAYPPGQWLLLYPTAEPGYATNVTVTPDNAVLS